MKIEGIDFSKKSVILSEPTGATKRGKELFRLVDRRRRRKDGKHVDASARSAQAWLLGPALVFANAIREVMGIGEGKLAQLPKGEKGKAQTCVLARALSNGWRSEVGYSRITLYHNNGKSIDFDACATALRRLGCARVLVLRQRESLYRDGVWLGYENKPYGVSFATPPLISSGFLPAFDEGLLPDLIKKG